MSPGRLATAAAICVWVGIFHSDYVVRNKLPVFQLPISLLFPCQNGKSNKVK
jgi:hypothetical protein